MTRRDRTQERSRAGPHPLPGAAKGAGPTKTREEVRKGNVQVIHSRCDSSTARFKAPGERVRRQGRAPNDERALGGARRPAQAASSHGDGALIG